MSRRAQTRNRSVGGRPPSLSILRAVPGAPRSGRRRRRLHVAKTLGASETAVPMVSRSRLSAHPRTISSKSSFACNLVGSPTRTGNRARCAALANRGTRIVSFVAGWWAICFASQGDVCPETTSKDTAENDVRAALASAGEHSSTPKTSIGSGSAAVGGSPPHRCRLSAASTPLLGTIPVTDFTRSSDTRSCPLLTASSTL